MFLKRICWIFQRLNWNKRTQLETVKQDVEVPMISVNHKQDRHTYTGKRSVVVDIILLLLSFTINIGCAVCFYIQVINMSKNTEDICPSGKDMIAFKGQNLQKFCFSAANILLLKIVSLNPLTLSVI